MILPKKRKEKRWEFYLCFLRDGEILLGVIHWHCMKVVETKLARFFQKKKILFDCCEAWKSLKATVCEKKPRILGLELNLEIGVSGAFGFG